MSNWAKCTEDFKQLGTSLEAPFESNASILTPNNSFFVCNAGPSIKVPRETYRLKIKGDAVGESLTLNLDDLQQLPQHTVTAVLECAGNQRSLFSRIENIEIERESQGEDVPWMLGGVGMAEWSGPRLADVLALAGVRPNAKWVAPMGLDVLNPECDIEIPMAIEKALHRDTLVGLRMNGDELPVDHGSPARLVVPGWVGTYWVKWVGWLTVSSEEIRNYRTDEYYVIDGSTVTRQNLKSSLCLPFPAELNRGLNQLTGFARSSGCEVERVAWSADGGEWQDAELISPKNKWGWTQFAFDWMGEPGLHEIRTKAWDEKGQTQPEKGYFNPGTLLYNAVIRHPIRVK